MMNFFSFILRQIFPSISMHKANKKLEEKLKNKNSQSNISNIVNADKIPIESYRRKYDETFEVKNKFEDKAKTNVIGITIAITVMMGADDLTGSLIRKYSCVALHWVSFIILLVAIVYLLVSGIDAIRVLFNKNSMWMVDISDLAADDNSIKEKYDDYANRNINQNIIRNNILCSSYICIRNALIYMMVLFILASVPLTSAKSKDNSIVFSPEYSISYSSVLDVPDDIDITKFHRDIIQDKESRGSINDGTIYSFVNINKKYLVQYKCFGSEIIVNNFACFDNMISEE